MILSCGEALIDMLAVDTPTGQAFAPHVGGAVFNTAIALGRLGVPAGFVSGISRDLFGTRIEAALHAAQVDAGLAIRSDRPTTLAFVTLTDGQARYAFYDENTAGRMLTPADMPAPPTDVQALFFGGISLAVEPCGAAYESLCHAAAGRHVIMLDPNIRPGFIRDAAAYRARLARMIAAADIVKLSNEDLDWLEGPGEIAARAQAILTRGPALVLVTEGAQGAQGFTARGHVVMPARPARLHDTVGAGDTFNAGVLAALWRAGALRRPALRDLPAPVLTAALDLGTRAAAITVSRAGANPPWAHEL
ncbi:carbohydrate kinase family protein [Phaeovulum vinaykumarii]|uniref:Fructokinase n=1 Tax=Phaeovulum vinaykumarii TaxID=407234 RepID=A0A1N7JK94_9RHOB|nr:carbohydrate kinase [Phaeovulum vinaykumarii]SIS49666.1 fructokinase [Phaeovulum vinaykumarii]SOB89829.1 fructokinase [Phaeovulum vinaykumarii]